MPDGPSSGIISLVKAKTAKAATATGGAAGRRGAGGFLLASSCCVLAVSFARADDAGEMLRRARHGLPPLPADRETALSLLEEWRESERFAPGTGDPALGRALTSLASGRALSPEEVGAVERMSARAGSDFAPGHAQPTAAVEGERDASRARFQTEVPSGRGGSPFAVVLAAGAGVVAVGLATILAAGFLKRRR